MIALVKHSQITGTVIPPGSKSYMQRACVLALLRDGKTVINDPSFSNDDRAVLQIVQKLGAEIEYSSHQIQITGNPSFNFSGELNCN
ncbi:MAG: 3-phosphoshikimate 1-carboxyvinyltransferase, partial [Chitinophagaceae bacterium]